MLSLQKYSIEISLILYLKIKAHLNYFSHMDGKITLKSMKHLRLLLSH